MSRFLESIKLHDGVFFRLDAHQQRVNVALAAFYPLSSIHLDVLLANSDFPVVGLYKCRVVYDSDVRLVEYVPYQLPAIKALQIVDAEIDTLPYKLLDRTAYNTAFAQRKACDDVLIVKNGLLTDTSYCNIAVFDGENWLTPRLPLLYGVNRAGLIRDSKLKETDIFVEQLKTFQSLRLFNAMIEFGELELPVSAISF